MPATAEIQHLPDLVRSYLARSLPPNQGAPALVRVHQKGEMRMKPGGRPMRFQATQDFAVESVSFSWRARFPIIGPLAMSVADEFAGGDGQLRVSLLGVPIQTQRGPETSVGEAMRYLAELPWVPYAITGNHELTWREIAERTVEVACEVGGARVAVRWQFNDAGDLVGATGLRPYTVGKTFVRTAWGGDFADYTSFNGVRVPAFGQAWWKLPAGRFVYWSGRLTTLELIGTAS